jgi:hypothetical protein
MANRTTYAEVINIMDTLSATTTTAIVTAYITSAHVMVNEVMGTTEVTDILTEIEKWLSAHLIAISRERQGIKEEAGTAKITYSDIFKKGGLASTTYGQMVLAMDTSGAFAALALRQASIFAVTSFD